MKEAAKLAEAYPDSLNMLDVQPMNNIIQTLPVITKLLRHNLLSMQIVSSLWADVHVVAQGTLSEEIERSQTRLISVKRFAPVMMILAGLSLILLPLARLR